MNPDSRVNGNYKLHLVLVEDDLYFMGSNGYPDHESVMRDMIPNANGTSVSLMPDVPYTQSFNFSVPALLTVENCRLIAFVQAPDRSVLNAAKVELPDIIVRNVPRLAIVENNKQILGDDGDGKLNPGESATFTITIENDCLWLGGEDVLGTLSTTSPYVTISANQANYHQIAACESVTNTSEPYQISVSPDAPPVAELEFELLITANLNSANPYEVVIPLTISMNLFQNHFPFAVNQPLGAGNAVIDLDGDGENEIVIGGEDFLLHVIALDGTEKTGFPFMAGDKIMGAPAIADIDNDGDLEVVFGARDGGIYVVQHDGSGEAIAMASSYLLATPSLTDFDNDGDLEIVAAGWGYDLLAVHHDGTPLAGFPKIIVGERMSTGVALADINADGIDEILIGTRSEKLHVFNHMGGELAGFPINLGESIKAPPTVTDLDGDNQIEILVGQDEGELWVISASGQVLWTHVGAGASIRTAIAVADFDGDGTRETIFSAINGFLTVVDHNGVDLPGWPLYVGTDCYSSPVVADIDDDGTPEIFVGSDDELIHGYSIDGSALDIFPIHVNGAVKGTPTLADLDLDGNLELVVGTDAEVAVIDIKSVGSCDEMWFTSRGDYRRTGTQLFGYVATEPSIKLPQSLTLAQNYPNPFNPTTKLDFEVPETAEVSLSIFDLRGHEIAQLLNSRFEPGAYSVTWSGRDMAEKPMETGIYFARLCSGGSEQVIKMMLLK